MKMDKNTMFMIGAGVLGFLAVRYFMNNKNQKTSNASGEQIGSRDCGNPSNYICSRNCQQLGGTFNPTDRKCYENGQAITGGLFGARVTKTKFSSACGCGA